MKPLQLSHFKPSIMQVLLHLRHTTPGGGRLVLLAMFRVNTMEGEGSSGRGNSGGGRFGIDVPARIVYYLEYVFIFLCTLHTIFTFFFSHNGFGV